METISLDVNDGCDCGEGEIGWVTPIQKDMGKKQDSDIAEDGKTMKIRAGDISSVQEKQWDSKDWTYRSKALKSPW